MKIKNDVFDFKICLFLTKKKIKLSGYFCLFSSFEDLLFKALVKESFFLFQSRLKYKNHELKIKNTFHY
jgi:hypothetical protein